MKNNNEIQLGGLWRFQPDPHSDGESMGFQRPDYCVRWWREVAVPSCFEAGCPDIDFYEGVCWYRRGFNLSDDWQGRRLVLRFEAVNYRARVWLNGQFLGENRDGFLPFEFEIQDAANWSGENILAVSVDNRHHPGDVPGMHVGWRGFGGIIREVELRATDHLYIDNIKAVAEPAEGGGTTEFRVSFANARDNSEKVSIAAEIVDREGNSLADMKSNPVDIEPGDKKEITLPGRVPGVRPWSPDSPILYTARISLNSGEQIVDARNLSFGFRRIESTPDGLLLNGEPIFLTGFNRHEDSPASDMATDLETTRRDLEAMKQAGANIVRLCHYPHHPGELDLCDRIGLLAFAEIPLYFWNDADDGAKAQPERAKAAERQLRRMIERDFNHPSVVFWSVSNETPESRPEVAEDNRRLIRLARSIDPSRLCVHVSNHWTSHPNFEEDDVICVNAYPSIDWGRYGHNPEDFDHTSSAGIWNKNLALTREKYPDKPILVTEFGYCSFAGTRGHSFGEDEHAKVLKSEFSALDRPLVCGAIIWCWADHAWPAGRFLGGLTVAPFGVVSRDRRKLLPYRAASDMFRARQGISSTASTGDKDSTLISMIRPGMSDIPDIPFPEGYSIRPMNTDDIGLWTDIERDAEQYIEISDGLFRNEFGDDIAAIGHRCFIIDDSRGRGVGTISAWYNRDYYGEEFGRIHWLAIRPSEQGRGLGKAALSYAMRTLAQWHDRCYLITSTERIPAIRLYLSFGFRPDMRYPNSESNWGKLKGERGIEINIEECDKR